MVASASPAFIRLLELAKDRTPGARARIVDSLGAFVVDPEHSQSVTERSLATDILRQLLRDAEMTVRRKLAERLANEPDAPRELVIQLASDDAEVARPVLLENLALRDADLIEVVQQRTLQHRLTIAMRKQVSEDLSAALVDIGELEVARTLLENPGAKIGRGSYEKLVERSREDIPLQEPLVRRTDLDPILASRMCAWVSVELRRYIVRHFDVDPALVDQAIRDSLAAVAADQTERRAASVGQERISASLTPPRGDDPSVLLDLLRAGEVGLFEAMFARITGMKPVLARRAIYEPGGKALAIACRASEIEKPIFAAIFLLARQARPGDKSVDPKELPTALSFFDTLETSTAQRTLEDLRAAGDRRAAS